MSKLEEIDQKNLDELDKWLEKIHTAIVAFQEMFETTEENAVVCREIELKVAGICDHLPIVIDAIEFWIHRIVKNRKYTWKFRVETDCDPGDLRLLEDTTTVETMWIPDFDKNTPNTCKIFAVQAALSGKEIDDLLILEVDESRVDWSEVAMPLVRGTVH